MIDASEVWAEENGLRHFANGSNWAVEGALQFEEESLAMEAAEGVNRVATAMMMREVA